MSSTARPATQLWREALAHIDGLLDRAEDERAAALASLAGTQPELHSLVNSLLRAQAEAETSGFLEPHKTPPPAGLSDGATLGPYRLESRLGVGGMGEVWLARRSDGLFDGEVAIKTLHPWFARGALRERFLREAQLLGRVSHPNISRLLDAGVTRDGALYLVLEYVRGIPLDQYCDGKSLDVERRLQVFRTVCMAVAHAHSHLIVHRDLKPSNVLVTDTGEVKLLDFGVATLLEADTASASDLTRLTGRAFTPEFAAPEQLRGETVTTATDVFSLGVMLHQLLTGLHPHAAHSGAALEHAVLHEDAPLPSRAVQAAADENAARQRGSTPTRLRRALAGDLDNIVARALEKNPSERFPGVQALADDIARHLDHQPIQARAASTPYRALKFLRRNRVAVAVGGVALAAVLVGASVAVWQADVARTEARKATAIRDFLVGVFERNSVSHPAGAEARKATAEELLAQSVTEIRTGLRDSPEVRRELLGVMSGLYSALDMQPKAIELLDEKLATERGLFGKDSLEVARTLGNLGYSQIQAGEYEKSEASSRQALAIFDARGDRTSLERALAYANLGQVAYRLGQGPEAVRSNYAAGLALVEEYHPRSQWRVEMLAGLSRAAGLDQKHQLVVDYCDQALQLIDSGAVESDGVVRGGVLEHKAHALGWVHRYEESDRLMHEAIAEFERAGGPGHSFAAEGRRQLGSNYMWSGRRAQASELLAESLSVMERVKGPDDKELTAHVRTSYATNLFLRGELAAAEPHMLHAWRNLQGPETALLPHTQINLLRLRTQQGRFREAREVAAGVDERTERIFGKGSWMHTTALVRLGELSLAEGRNDAARAIFSRVLEVAKEAPDAMTNNPAAARLGLLQLALSEAPVATTVVNARTLLADIENSKGRHDMPDESAAAHMLLGRALLQAGDAPAARPYFATAVGMREKMDAPQNLWLAEARLYQALGLHAQGESAPARALLALAEQAHRTQGQVGPQFSRLLVQARTTLAR